MFAVGCAPGDSERGDGPAPSARSLPEQVPPRPVQIGFDGPRFDACAGFGRVRSLDANSDQGVPIYAAPSERSEQIDAVFAGNGVAMCQQVGG